MCQVAVNVMRSLISSLLCSDHVLLLQLKAVKPLMLLLDVLVSTGVQRWAGALTPVGSNPSPTTTY